MVLFVTPVNQQIGGVPMTQLRQVHLSAKSWSIRRTTLLIVLGLAVFLPMRVSVSASFETRTEGVRRLGEKRVALNPCGQGLVRLDPFKPVAFENALRAASSAPRLRPRPALRFDDEIGVDVRVLAISSAEVPIACTSA